MKTINISKSILGPDLYEALNKAIVKMGTNSVVDITELHDALKIAPKSIIAFLMRELGDMKKDGAKEIKLPWDNNSLLLINKKDSDVYAGRISKDGKTVHEFSLCSIPQLAAHLLSFSEMYDQIPDEVGAIEPNKDGHAEDLKEKVKQLEEKINTLMMLVASQVSQTNKVVMDRQEFIDEHKNLIEVLKSPSHKDDKEEMKEQEKELEDYIKKNEASNDLKKELIKNIKAYSLRKAGLAPTMPKPPKPGTKVGGNQGITQAGFHGPKTTASDTNTKPRTMLENPHMQAPKPGSNASMMPKTPKTPKLAASEKTLIVAKSELKNQCADCRESIVNCFCFRALSAPIIEKRQNDMVRLKLGPDWDSEAVEALYKNILSSKLSRK